MLADISNVDAIYIVCGRTDMRKSIDGLCAIIEYSCGSKSQIRKFGNRSSGTRKSPFLCLITCPFLWGY